MTIPAALGFLESCVWLALAGLGMALIYAAFFGRLAMRGLLSDKQTGLFSMARLQLVGTSIVFSILYLQEVATTQQAELPEFDTAWAAALSGGVYGIAKLNSSVKASTALSLLQTILESQRRTP